MKKPSFIALVLLAFVLIMNACQKDSTDDTQLFEALSQTGYAFYQNGNTLSAAGSSPHGDFKLRVNDVAQTVLDSLGELPTGMAFPTGSIIVKELYVGGNLDLYAVMKKDPSNSNAQNGWLWAEYGPSGSTVISLNKKGSNCTGCHSQSPNRDFTLTYDLH